MERCIGAQLEIWKVIKLRRIRCIDAQLEILESYLAAFELDVLTLN